MGTPQFLENKKETIIPAYQNIKIEPDGGNGLKL